MLYASLAYCSIEIDGRQCAVQVHLSKGCQLQISIPLQPQSYDQVRYKDSQKSQIHHLLMLILE